MASEGKGIPTEGIGVSDLPDPVSSENRSESTGSLERSSREPPRRMLSGESSKSSGGKVSGVSTGEKKIGHRKVVDGKTVYKHSHSDSIMAGIQMGIRHSVGSITPKEQRDLLMADFEEIETVEFPSAGGSVTPAHTHPDFRFKSYAPRAFRHFREAFGIAAEDFMLSLCNVSLRELSNPGASGSIFYISDDDMFIIKTVQRREAKFLRELLPGYYMNLMQNQKTLIPKFFGLYNLQNNLGRNIRFIVMNNILPSTLHYHQRFDLKGSTFKRKASDKEKAKPNPTLKDLDFIELHPDGLALNKASYDWLVRTIKRDCLVLESFQIMDFSLLLGIHYMDQSSPGDSRAATPTSSRGSVNEASPNSSRPTSSVGTQAGQQPKDILKEKMGLKKQTSFHAGYMVSDSGSVDSLNSEETFGGIVAYTASGEQVMIFLGIIDILQQYKFKKKLEHAWKSIWFDGSAVSVIKPKFYSSRFRDFLVSNVFRDTSVVTDRILSDAINKRQKFALKYVLKKEKKEGKKNRDLVSTPVDNENRNSGVELHSAAVKRMSVATGIGSNLAGRTGAKMSQESKVVEETVDEAHSDSANKKEGLRTSEVNGNEPSDSVRSSVDNGADRVDTVPENDGLRTPSSGEIASKPLEKTTKLDAPKHDIMDPRVSEVRT